MVLTSNGKSEIARIFNDALDRCLQRGDFLDRFYEIFLAADPRVARKFQGTDFSRQKRMLTASLYVIMTVDDERPQDLEHLEILARRHGKDDLAIEPELYEIWLDSLLQAARECDPYWTREIGAVWRMVMGTGIRFMIRGGGMLGGGGAGPTAGS